MFARIPEAMFRPGNAPLCPAVEILPESISQDPLNSPIKDIDAVLNR